MNIVCSFHRDRDSWHLKDSAFKWIFIFDYRRNRGNLMIIIYDPIFNFLYNQRSLSASENMHALERRSYCFLIVVKIKKKKRKIRLPDPTHNLSSSYLFLLTQTFRFFNSSIYPLHKIIILFLDKSKSLHLFTPFFSFSIFVFFFSCFSLLLW
jgi:hypothetical protein